MAEEASRNNRFVSAILRACPSALNALRLLALLLVIGCVALWVYFHVAQERTIVVEATTGALEVKLSSELSGKAFRNVWVCKQRVKDDRPAIEPPTGLGCPSRRHHFLEQEPITAPLLPSGSTIKLTSLPSALRMDVVSIPSRYREADVMQMVGGAFVVTGQDALKAFGTLPLSGAVTLGALFAERDRVSVTEGSYQIRGYTPIGLLGGDMRELRGGGLLSGAKVRFLDSKGETADGHVAITIADPEMGLMRVTAISEYATNNLGIGYYFTEEVTIRPSFVEAIIIDPLFQLLVAVFGAIAGYSWLRRILAL